MKLWIVGQKVGDDRDAWEFQGVFSSEELADRACRSKRYFMAPAVLDVELPHDPVDTWEGARYTRSKDTEHDS